MYQFIFAAKYGNQPLQQIRIIAPNQQHAKALLHPAFDLYFVAKLPYSANPRPAVNH